MAKTISLIALEQYSGKGPLPAAADGEVLTVAPVIAAALLRTGKFKFHTPVVLDTSETERRPRRRRRSYRRRDLVAE